MDKFDQGLQDRLTDSEAVFSGLIKEMSAKDFDMVKLTQKIQMWSSGFQGYLSTYLHDKSFAKMNQP